MNRIHVGIIGGAGYTGGEVLRILLHHPGVHISFVTSRRFDGKPVHSVHHDVIGDTSLHFTNDIQINEVDLVFLCLPHGQAQDWISQFPPTTSIIDLSQDFRVQIHPERTFVYGLPEIHRDIIASAKSIANPGCFATAIQLTLLPLLKSSLRVESIYSICTTGSTGSGIEPTDSTHYSWRSNNLSVYKAFDHQHLDEITKTIQTHRSDLPPITMIPQRGAFTRGILCCTTIRSADSRDVIELFEHYYMNEPFVFICNHALDVKQVVNTNKSFLSLQIHEDQVLITCIIDNLLKGAAGQAIQNMNIMMNFPEHTGLQLKASVY